jgi:hypothetical protein
VPFTRERRGEAAPSAADEIGDRQGTARGGKDERFEEEKTTNRSRVARNGGVRREGKEGAA